jgi:tRNA(His) 5'-end guanylyltransferase
MPVNDELGKRMKEYYEQVPKYRLTRRTPVMIRIDGKAFHTFTRGFQRPFDELLGNTMRKTMEYLCNNIQGCIFGFTQSDEISLVLSDYRKLNSDAWFGYEIQKMCSIAASMATMAFNRYFRESLERFYCDNISTVFTSCDEQLPCPDGVDTLLNAYRKALVKGAMFDARVFNIPKEEVVNCIYWRQLDAARNSVQMV